jgi:hypothetical protein
MFCYRRTLYLNFCHQHNPDIFLSKNFFYKDFKINNYINGHENKQALFPNNAVLESKHKLLKQRLYFLLGFQLMR